MRILRCGGWEARDWLRFRDDTPAVPGQRFVIAFEGFAHGPRVHDYLAEMTREVFAGRDGQFLTVGEIPAVTPEEARHYTDPARGEVNMVFQFEHVSVDHSPANKFDYLGLDRLVLKNALYRWQEALAETGWNSLYWGNHDQPRVVSRFGDEAAALAGLARISRDNARTPMQWDAGPNPGFTAGDPWLPVNPNHAWLNAAAQIDAPDSVFAHYRALIRLRHDLPVLVDGDFTALLAQDPQIWAYTRTTPDRKLLVIANCGRDPRVVEIGREWTTADLLLGNLPDTPTTSTSDHTPPILTSR
ncbi:MAG TPA: alpha-amylase family glycosyl hydrolase [Mycobacterium sp.]